MHPNRLWSTWLSLVLELAGGFTRPGRRRLVEWLTGLAFNVEEHTITQSLIGLDRPQDWRALGSFPQDRSWNPPHFQISLALPPPHLPKRPWYGYPPSAPAATQVDPHSPPVRGSYTLF